MEIDIALTNESAAETIPEVQIHQLHHQNRDYQGPEYKNNISLWRTITNEMQNFWCNRDFVECQHFDDDFSVSTKQYNDGKRKFKSSLFYRKHVNGERINRE